MIDKLIEQMDNWLGSNRPEYYRNLLPGLPSASLTEFEKRFEIALPEAFVKLYSWRNGQPSNQLASFYENRMFCSLADIADTKEMLDEMIGIDFDDPKWWRREWVPFLSNGSGDYLCLDLKAADGGSAGQLIEFLHDDEAREIEFESVASWLNHLVEAMENGKLEIF